MAEKCFIRESTMESRGLSGATPSLATHGWPATATEERSDTVTGDAVTQ